MASSKKEKEETEYIKWWKYIFYPGQIAKLKSNNKLISDYETLKSSIDKLIESMKTCELNVTTTYNYAKESIMFEEIVSSLEKINEYATNLKNAANSFDSVYTLISKRIRELEAANREIKDTINI